MDSTASPTPSSPERGSLGTGDLASKYTRLASEYSKVRAQLTILKRAIIEEQSSKNHFAEALKEKETRGRKIEAEMDALTFRNIQLARRVEILQQESEQKQQKTVKKATRNEIVAASEDVNSVMGEELSLKIAENARLHAALDEVDKKYEAKISNLTSHISDLESQLKRLAQKDRAEDTKQKDLIQGLKVDNVELVSKIGLLEKDLTDSHDRITVLRVQLESTTASAQKTLRNGPPTSDLMLPLNATEARIQTVEVLSTLGESVQNFVASMSDLHTYWEHRLKDLRPNLRLTDQSASLSSLLLQNVKYLRPIEQSFQDVLSNILSEPKGSLGFKLVSNFSGFSQYFHNYVHYAVQDVEPLVIACLQQESNSSSCPPTQQAKNGQLVTALRSFGKTLTSLAKQILSLAGADNSNEALESVENITVLISQLNQQSTELNTVYTSKANDEAQLPTVSEALRNTNMCIISALCSLSQGTSVLSHSLSDNLPKIGLLLTSEFIEVIEEIEEVPEEPTLDHHHPGGDDGKINDLNDSIGNLKHMLETYSEKLKKSEQKKEHWKLECQLLQMKLDKLKLVDGDADNAGDHDHQVVGETPGAANERIEELVAEKLMADSKATHFYLECGSMQKRIKFWEKAKKKAEDDLKLAHNDIEELEEESKTTTVNYDGQLSMMSEHLANMNEKLTMQTDEIDRLKYELSSSSAGGKK